MENTHGCTGNLIVVIISLIIGFWGYSTTSNLTDTVLGETNYPFVLVEDGVNYSFKETFNCQFAVAGNVEFLNGNSVNHENIVIMIQPLGTYDDRSSVTVIIGNDKFFGENGWSQLLVGNYWYLVWVHDLTLNTALSPQILVDDLNCASDHIVAQVNFQQIHPLK